MKQETLKKIIELADGFEIKYKDSHWSIRDPSGAWYSLEYFVKTKVAYPLLLRRAVEEWNRKGEYGIYLYVDYMIIESNKGIQELTGDSKEWDYDNYEKTDYLTPQEQAIEACLIELLEDK